MKHLKIIILFIVCMVDIKPLNNLNAAVPHNVNEKPTTENYYDYEMLKIIIDSLQEIEPRNSILPENFGGKVFFNVRIYRPIREGDQENIYIGEKGRSNRCILGAFELATIITPCAYNPQMAFVNVKYVNPEDDNTFVSTIYNISSFGQECKFAYAFIDQ